MRAERLAGALVAATAAVVTAAVTVVGVQQTAASLTTTADSSVTAVVDTFADALEQTLALPPCPNRRSLAVVTSSNPCRDAPGLPLTSAGPRHASFLTSGDVVGDASTAPVLVTLTQTEDSLTVRTLPTTTGPLGAGAAGGAVATGSTGRVTAAALDVPAKATLRYYGAHQEQILAPAAGQLVPAELSRVTAVELIVDGDTVTHRWVFARPEVRR